jgi:hypothetical protein
VLSEQPIERIESADKPVEVVVSKTPECVSPPPPPAPTNTAREARRIVEALNAPPPQHDPLKQSKLETQKIAPTTRPDLPERLRVELEQPRASVDKPAQDKPPQTSFELKQFEDKSLSVASRAAHVERTLGRPGAPRWGVIGPRPTSVRRVSKLQPDEVEPGGEHGVGSTPPE